MELKVTFLGTASGAPTRMRFLSCVGVQFPQSSEVWIIDCGEGAQYRLAESQLRVSQLTRIFITHMHGDHVFGLPGLLASRSLQIGSDALLTLYGPAELEAYVRNALYLSRTHLGYPLEFVSVSPGVIHSGADYYVACAPVDHGIEAYAYAIHERDRPGTFDVARARALGIPPGPLYGRLKAGGVVELPDGRVIEGSSLCGPTMRGLHVAFSGDTSFSPAMVELARNADLLVHEATFSQEDRELAGRSNHSTAIDAANVAKEASAGTLVLTHFSSRYDAHNGASLDKLLLEARGVFPGCVLANDLEAFVVTRKVGDTDPDSGLSVEGADQSSDDGISAVRIGPSTSA